LLDAFDEDTLAIVDHGTRLSNLLQLCGECRHVVIACRTQFFFSDEEIPHRSGVLRFGPTGPGESKEYLINKVYLSPFSDKQVREYLRRRFPIWKYNQRREAARICHQVADLAARPMLLAHIQDLQAKQARVRNISDVYEELLQAWVQRELTFVDGEALIRFSEELAVDIHRNRIARGTETIPFAALQPLAARFGIPLEEWQLSGRSLLNRTSDGSRKFAHRSIMEFLVIRRFLNAPETVGRTQWTDQMKKFFWEMIAHSAARGVPLSPSLSLADMSGFHKAPEWQPNLSLGSCPPLVEGTFESRGGPARPRGLYVLDYVSGKVYLWPAITHSFDWQDLHQTPIAVHRDSLQSLWSAAGSTVQAFGIEVHEWDIVRTEHLPSTKLILDLLPPEITAAVDLEFTIWSPWPGSRS
jgi:hypothetical protein